MSRAVPHDENWFEGVYRDCYDDIHRYLRRRVTQGAEDLVAEVFMVAWRRRNDVPDPALPWLYGVAANVLKHASRTRARHLRTEAKVLNLRHRPVTDPQMRVVDTADVRYLVEHAFENMNAKDAEILKLWAWEELSPAELAVALDVKPGTVRSRLSRARARMAEALGVADSGTDEEVLGHLRAV